ncbi:hypothetical protein BN135_1053 [Cronobacter muytjensii 530]
MRELARLTRVFRIQAHGGGEFLHAGGGLLQRGGLFFGTRGEIVIAGGDFRRAAPDILAAVADGAYGFTQLILHRGQQRHQFPDTVATKRLDGLAEIATGDQGEVVADFLKRFDQQRHQITVGQQQKQQADDDRDDNDRFGGGGHAVDIFTRGVKLAACRSVEFLGARAKRAAEDRGHFTRMGAVRLWRAFARELHLRDHAFIQQLLPVGDHFLRHGRIERARREFFKLFELARHAVERLSDGFKGFGVRRAVLHCAG